MKIIKYFLRILFIRKWWLILLPLFATLLAINFTRNLGQTFSASTTIFTGFASGYSIESDSKNTINNDYVNTAMDNLINIIKSKTTLENVSLSLYAENMMYGDSTKDNNTITKNNYKEIYNKTPKEVRSLIDKKSKSNTLKNLENYKKASPKNFVYGLFNWNHRHYCYDALNRIKVKRLSNSDMMEVNYESDDPGIAYNTIKILNDEFIKEYQTLRFGETDSVINYFQSELLRVSNLLRDNEDSLTDYNVENRVINYNEQTNQVAFQSREYNLQYVKLKMDYNSSKAILEEIENRMDINLKLVKNNSKFIQYLQNVSKLNYDIALIESKDSINKSDSKLFQYKNQLIDKEKEMNDFITTYSNQKYTKEGISADNIIDQWFSELMKNIKSEAELKVLEQRKLEIDEEYLFYAPIGSTIKRKERQINFLESTYLNILHNLNSALLRKKNLQMTTSTLKIINPPILPLNSLPSKRKMIVWGVLFGSFIFILSYFLIIELIDRTLKNKLKSQLLIGREIMGAFPSSPKGKYRRYKNEILGISNQYLFNTVFNNLNPNKEQNIINIISNENGEGKSFIAENLYDIFNKKGIKTKYISYHKDYNQDESKYLFSNSINDFYNTNNEQIIIIEHPSFKNSVIPINITNSSSVNLFIGDANRAWKDTDQILFDRLLKQCNNNIFIYLNRASIESTEGFTGLLPPYSFFRKLIYKIIQMDFNTK